MIGCGPDRSLRLWDCELGGAFVHFHALEAPITTLGVGQRQLLAVCGFPASRNLSLQTLRIHQFKNPDTQVKNRLGIQSRTNLTQEGEVPLRLQRVLMMCYKKRLQQGPYGESGLPLVSRCVLPFLRTQCTVSLSTDTIGQVALASKESVVRASLGGVNDQFAIVGFDRFRIAVERLERELLQSQSSMRMQSSPGSTLSDVAARPTLL